MSRYEYPNASYYAYNETFVDDEGLQLYQQNDIRSSSQYIAHDDIENDEEDDYLDRAKYCQNAERYDERLDYLNLSVRESPVGEGSVYRQVESTNTNRSPKKHQPLPQPPHQQHRYEQIRTRHRSSSVPSRRRISNFNSTANVFAPMMAQADRQQTLRRSHSTILPPRHRQVEQAREFRRPAQICSTPRIQRQNTTPVRLKSYSHFMSPAEMQNIPSETNQRSTAIISPNYRQQNQSAVPLLANSPVKFQYVSRSPDKTNSSWMNIPRQRLPNEPLWFAGLILLFTGGGACLLCLYILSKIGRQYYLDFGAISGFVCLTLGMIGCKTSRWLPHRHYVTGYILLSALSLFQCGVLAVLASDSKQLGNDIVDIAGGAVCALSVLSIIMATLGFLTSACCNLPPPDSRVSHSVQGFTV